MSELCQIDELINKFKLQNNTPLTRLWINFLLIKKKRYSKNYKSSIRRIKYN